MCERCQFKSAAKAATVVDAAARVLLERSAAARRAGESDAAVDLRHQAVDARYEARLWLETPPPNWRALEDGAVKYATKIGVPRKRIVALMGWQ